MRMNILIYRTGRLGDFLVAVPAIKRIREIHPNARITLLTMVSSDPRAAAKTWRYASQLEPPPWLSFIYPALVDEVLTLRSLKDWRELWTLRTQVKAGRFDLAYILPFSVEGFSNRFKKWLLLRFAGVSCSVRGLRTPDGRLFARLPRMDQVQTALAFVPESAIAPRPYELTISPDATREIEAKWEAKGLKGRTVLVLFVGGTYAHKRWPVDRFAQVGQDLARSHPDLAVVLIGSADERSLSDVATGQLSVPHWNACGETTLHQLAAILRRASVFLGNDSGPAHLAAALGVPCVTVMSGVHHAGMWEPHGARSVTIRHDVPCTGCGAETRCPLGTSICVTGIEVNRVLAAVESIVRDRHA